MNLSRPSLIAFLYVALLALDPVSAQETETLAHSVQPFVDREELAGAVMLVANRDEVLALETVGWANIADNKPMRTDSMFWIASQSKPITAAALMILVDEGKVQLDDPVEKYLPEFKGQMVIAEKDDKHLLLMRPEHPITVREILSHTSGLPYKSALEEPTLDRFTLEARVRSYAMTPLIFEPGTSYQYSNAGINTAARIIEVVSGISFEEFLETRLFQPLGMTDTTFWPNESQIARIADSYKPGKEKKGLEKTTISQVFYPLDDRELRFPMPAGGLFSTARDVARFYQMLLSSGVWGETRILSEAAVAELIRKQTPKAVNVNYGFGFSLSKDTFGHNGAYSTSTTANWKQGLIYVWLVQHAGFPGEGAKAQQAFRDAAVNQFAPINK